MLRKQATRNKQQEASGQQQASRIKHQTISLKHQAANRASNIFYAGHGQFATWPLRFAC
jgi:hypothetical protein